jgi:hypothetical protein
VTSKPDFRQKESHGLPFRARDSLRKRINLTKVPDDDDDDGTMRDHVYALTEIQPAFAYDHLKVLSQAERTQYVYWTRDQTCDIQHLWFWSVEQLALARQPAPLHLYCSRQVSKTFKMLDDAAAQVLVQEVARDDWPVLDQNVQLCIILPPSVVGMIVSATWQKFAMPSPYSPAPYGTPKWFKRMLHDGIKAEFENTIVQAALEPQPIFELRGCSALAAHLRLVCNGSQGSDSLVSWIVKLQTFSDSLHYSKKSTTHLQLIEFAMLSEILKNTDHLKQAMVRSMKIALPSEIYEALREHVEQIRIPDKSEICRLRLRIDVAYMMLIRVEHWMQTQSGRRHVRFLSWDSSPQFRRDYELVLVESACYDDLSYLLQHSWLHCIGSAQGFEMLFDEEEEEGLKEHIDSITHLGTLITRHALPCVMMGFGASSFAHKFRALLHSLRLEHFNNASLARYCKDILAIVSDDGVERLIENVRPMDLQVLCPWFQDTTDADIRLSIKQNQVEGDDDQANADADGVFEDIPPDGFDLGGGDVGDEVFEDPDVPQADLTRSLPTSGLHHVIDNATQGFEDVLPSYHDNIARCQQICKLVRNRDTQVKLLERCFSCPLGKQLHHHIKSFKGHIFPGRWGTVAFSIPEILKVKGPLRWGWDKDRYMRGAFKFRNCG